MTYTNHQIKYFAWEITKKRSASDVDRVRQLLANGMTAVEVEAVTDVHRSTVSAIKTERQWATQA